jgi:hypothetical protein
LAKSLCFGGEFGISPGRLAELAVVLGEDAVTRRTVVVVEDLRSFARTLADAGFTPDEIAGLQRSFMLRARDRWDAVERPFRGRDWWPWKYRRRLSLMTRPFNDEALCESRGRTSPLCPSFL